jgi:hypothetical protein
MAATHVPISDQLLTTDRSAVPIPSRTPESPRAPSSSRRAAGLVVAWAVVSMLLMVAFAMNSPWAALCRS